MLRYSNAILSVAYSVLGDFHEAQDVTQEAFVKCFRRLHTLKDPARLSSRLYSIAYRTSLDFLKKKKAALPYNETIALIHLADDFASYFRPYRLGRRFEQTVCEQILKRMGHFYIPVTNKKQTTDWFVRHFHLAVNTRGNLLLESGHELYLLECLTHAPQNMPVLTFAVSNIHDLWSQLIIDGVVAGPIETNEWFGKHFVFYDPDGNQYHAVENQ